MLEETENDGVEDQIWHEARERISGGRLARRPGLGFPRKIESDKDEEGRMKKVQPVAKTARGAKDDGDQPKNT